jgi:L-asparaginase
VSRVAVVFTGGTISMRRDRTSGGAVPVLDGAAILNRTRGLEQIADVEAIDWGLVPASHLSLNQVLDLARTVQAAVDRADVDGAVVVQGTDTIEEVAFGVDLVMRGPKPVVFVGAMRNADEDGYDGPSNLRDAVRVAASTELRGQGVVVTMAGLILPADDAVKTHTDSYTTFQAPNMGPLGRIEGERVIAARQRVRRRTLRNPPQEAAEPVVLITVVTGMDGLLVRLAAESDLKGLVIAATGVGNTHPGMLDACREQMSRGVPVVLTTRCVSGRAKATYAFPGGGLNWERAGAIFAGYLGGPKARVALSLGLGAGLDEAKLRALFAD